MLYSFNQFVNPSIVYTNIFTRAFILSIVQLVIAWKSLDIPVKCKCSQVLVCPLESDLGLRVKGGAFGLAWFVRREQRAKRDPFRGQRIIGSRFFLTCQMLQIKYDLSQKGKLHHFSNNNNNNLQNEQQQTLKKNSGAVLIICLVIGVN